MVVAANNKQKYASGGVVLKKVLDDVGNPIVVPPGRVSQPSSNDSNWVFNLGSNMPNIVQPEIASDIIPLIRKLIKVNGDMSIAATDMIRLINSGHSIYFDNSVDTKKSTMMLEHLNSVSKNWNTYTGGIYGTINKMIAQAFISGAISVEAVPNETLDGISHITLVPPEEIVFSRDNRGQYIAYQKPNNAFSLASREIKPLIKLNTLTYKYCSINGDEDSPYGIPPFLAALEGLSTQKDMKININNIMKLMGLLGYLEMKMAKPNKEAYENQASYESRLKSVLLEARRNIKNGMSDGVLVGFDEDHEYDFKPTSASLQNVSEIWNINQQNIANGLQVAPSIIGLSNSSKTEGGTSIMFSKMLSQLTNIQQFLVSVLEWVYRFECKLKGWDPKGLHVRFNKSTITDDLKYQQGLEYKIRNLVALYQQGIIGQEEFAREMGYDVPDQKEPREPIEDPLNDASKKKKREDDKDKSDRKSREKDKPIPKTKPGQTKPE